MPTLRRSLTVVLGALTAIVAAGVATTAATGSEPGARTPTSDDHGRSTTVSGADPDGGLASPTGGIGSLPLPPEAARDPQIAELDGTPVAQGTHVRVERVTAAGDVTIFRVTVTAGPYVMRAIPAVLSVDGRPLGTAVESDDLDRLVLYTDDPAAAAGGGTIALTYGLPGEAPVEWSSAIEAVAP